MNHLHSPILELLNELSAEARRVEKLGSSLEAYAVLQQLANKSRQLDTHIDFKKMEAANNLCLALQEIIEYKPKAMRQRSWVEDVRGIAQHAVDIYINKH